MSAPFGIEVSTPRADRVHVAAAQPAVGSVRGLLDVALAGWAAGVMILVARRSVLRRRLLIAVRAARPLHNGREAEALERARGRLGLRARIELRSSPALHEPGVIGALHPLVLWPSALTARLTDEELDAIFVHEVSHIRRRDNLAATIHALIGTALWFHPIVWWVGARLLEERERACDEEVVNAGSERQAYAAGILKVCAFCLRTPAAWVAGVAGGRLTTRVEEIMSVDRTRSLRRGQRTALAMAAVLIAAIPVALGAMHGVRIGQSPVLQNAAAIANPIVPAARANPPDAGPPGAVPPADPPRAATLPVPAASQVSTGRLTGVVVDQSDRVIPSATVTIPGAQRTTITNAEGRYVFANLQPGLYEMVVTMPSFRPDRGTVRVDPGVELTRDVRLMLGSVQEAIEVTAEGAPVSRPPASESRLQNYLDLARAYWKQGQIEAAERAMAQASEVIRSEAASPVPPPGPVTVHTTPAGQVQVGGDIREPRKIQDARPVYPPEARSAGVEGMVIIEAVIATDGSVKNARVLRSVPGLDQAALDAVLQWKFRPTALNGQPVEVVMTVTANFTLK